MRKMHTHLCLAGFVLMLSCGDSEQEKALKGSGSETDQLSAWTEILAGKNLYVSDSSSSYDSNSAGSISSAGGEKIDLYLCTDKSFYLLYEDDTCTLVMMPDVGDASTCDDTVSESCWGTWVVRIAGNTPYLDLTCNNGGALSLTLGYQGSTIYLQDTPTETYENSQCN
ncbi:MAG: hypothetical protein QGI45_04640 [Myxococcota bacterium]|jgi:hypothetical protein|nr:hypothetical protein [Myxococcota bacterium]